MMNSIKNILVQQHMTWSAKESFAPVYPNSICGLTDSRGYSGNR
jgi:hypothetical protein